MNTPSRTGRARKTPLLGSALGAAAIAAGLALGAAVPAAAQDDAARTRFVRSIKLEGLRGHLSQLQRIADENGGNRAAGTPGYRFSGRYVIDQLRQAGYRPVVQEFSYTQFIEKRPAVLRPIGGGDPYVPGRDILSATYSGNGSVRAEVVPVNDLVIPATPDPSSNAGCEPADFPAAIAGNIALIQRGTCDFIVKVENAIDAGAIGVIIFNEGNANVPDRIPLFGGTLGRQVDVPVITASYAVGVELAENGGRYGLRVQATFKETNTFNVLADTRGGNPDQTIVVGAHLDSVPEGPGINDNGTGTAAVLEIAKQMAAQNIEPANRVRFAFWGGEEDGLLGSTHYVDTLPNRELADIALNLNFDMLGSPNYVRFVYDGNGSDGDAGPEGSAQIERVFNQYFKAQGLATAPTAFDGRSDYGPFIEVGIPAGGLFSGAEGIKTKREARQFGGTAGEAYDECYHQACDTTANVNNRGLIELSKGAADSTIYWALRANLPAQDRAKVAQIADTFDYRGDRAKR